MKNTQAIELMWFRKLFYFLVYALSSLLRRLIFTIDWARSLSCRQHFSSAISVGCLTLLTKIQPGIYEKRGKTRRRLIRAIVSYFCHHPRCAVLLFADDLKGTGNQFVLGACPLAHKKARILFTVIPARNC